MKKTLYFAAILAVIAIVALVGPTIAQNTPNYMVQGGATWVIGSGGDLQVDSGGTIDIESGGTLEIAGTAAAGVNDVSVLTEGTDFLIHYEIGNDFFVALTDQSANAVWGLAALE